MMISGFFGVICMGHLSCTFLIMLATFVMYSELLQISRRKYENNRFIDKLIDWYLFIFSVYLIAPSIFLRQQLTG